MAPAEGISAMRVAEPFESSGVFWRPSTPENKVHGVLNVAEDGEVTLHTFGIATTPPKATPNQLEPAPPPHLANRAIGRIVGITKDRPVTMDGCFYGPSNYNMSGGISDSTIRSRHTYLGVRYEEDEATTFDSVTFYFAGLQEWLMLSGFSFDATNVSSKITWAPTDPISITLPDDKTLTFELSARFPSVSLFPDSVTIGQHAHVTVTTTDPKPIEYFTKAVLPLEMLLSLAMDRPTGITKMVAETPDLVHQVDDEDFRVPIDVYTELSRILPKSPEVGWHRMLFTYRDVQDRFADMLRGWFVYCDTAEPAINLYFATASGAYRYIEGQFLSSAQAIEALHRRTFEQEKHMPDSDFDEMLRQIDQVLPNAHRDRILGHLRYANGPSFRRRLGDVFKQFRHHYGDNRERRHLMQEIVDSRNYLTHYDSATRGKAPDSKSLIGFQLKLEALFQMHMLQALRFEPSDIDEIVRKRLDHKLNATFLE